MVAEGSMDPQLEMPFHPPEPTERPQARHAALRIALIYLAFGEAWIVGTDWWAGLLPANWVSTLKGTLFMVVTALLLFLLVQRFVRRMGRAERESQAQLEGVAEQYRRLFDRNPMAMIIFDVETRRIVAANDVALLLFGYSREELLQLRTLDLMVEEERQRAVGRTARLREDAVVPIEPLQGRRRDGRIIYVESVTHLVTFNGQKARIALLSDVTERLQAERSLAQYRAQLEQRVAERTAELWQANRRLEEEVRQRRRIEEDLRTASGAAEAANASKSTFLANTSHEIRTPLTSILGYADLLRNPALTPEERRGHLEVVSQNARHLLALIDDLLDLSRAEMGKMRVTFSNHSPREVARQAVELLRPRAAEKGLALTLSIADDVPGEIVTDGMRLRQILLNLLANAIKFTERGSVGLTLKMREGRGQDGGLICFEVRDTGVGIEAPELQRIFEPFYQATRGAARPGGVGLGLAIARQLAIQMGGVLTARSAPGEGSAFTLVLPPRPAEAAADSLAAQPAALTGHILLAEDTSNIRLLMDEYLTRTGARVTTVGDGTEAVARVREAPAGESFDLILLDLHMPSLDGTAAMRHIRALGYDGPIVGLTADYLAGSETTWAAQGWSAMAAKPIDRQTFIPLLARLMEERRAQEEGRKNDPSI
jgi:PAS domain S-box-containing protein